MEIPGIAPLSGQPTLTNPLSRERLLEGRVTTSQGIETYNTEVMREQPTTRVKSAEVVGQASDSTPIAFEVNHFGGTIDIIV
ncbi:MAG: hypothetical protein COA63_010170 [Methylophaga sp.]|nr:hypothetical protein [Methylophaga sp.]